MSLLGRSLGVSDLDLVTRKNIPIVVWFGLGLFETARLTLSEFSREAIENTLE